MSNLRRDELKFSLKKEIKSALEKLKNPEAIVTIRFTENKQLIGTEKFWYFAGHIKYKKVSLYSLGTEKAIDLIVNNIYYSCFSYISTKIKIGEIQCHGHGDFWGCDKITIHYDRIKE